MKPIHPDTKLKMLDTKRPKPYNYAEHYKHCMASKFMLQLPIGMQIPQCILLSLVTNLSIVDVIQVLVNMIALN